MLASAAALLHLGCGGLESVTYSERLDALAARQICPPESEVSGIRVSMVLGPAQLQTQRPDRGPNPGCVILDFSRRAPPPRELDDVELPFGFRLVSANRVLRERIPDCGTTGDPGRVTRIPGIQASGSGGFEDGFERLTLDVTLLFEDETEPIEVEFEDLRVRNFDCDDV